MELDFEKPVLTLESEITELKKKDESDESHPNADKIRALEGKRSELLAAIYAKLTPWQTVQVARHPNRPTIRDYLGGVFSEFIELHGDRSYGDDHAIIGGFATIDGHRVMIVGHQKGKTVEENIKANFGMGNPEGYRKALRLMKLAEKYKIPVICFVDTPGAYPGLEGEARGQAEAIARNLEEMARLTVPVVVLITGEGGSGGALGIAVGNSVLMLSHAVYSVISPEGCASILWRDGAKAPEAAEALKITAPSLLSLKIIDKIITEPTGGAHRDHPAVFDAVRKALVQELKSWRRTSPKHLVQQRFEKFCSMGRMKKR